MLSTISRPSGLLLHGEQFDPEVTQPVEQAVQLGLVADLSDKHGPVWAGFQGHPLEGGLEALAQPSPPNGGYLLGPTGQLLGPFAAPEPAAAGT